MMNHCSQRSWQCMMQSQPLIVGIFIRLVDTLTYSCTPLYIKATSKGLVIMTRRDKDCGKPLACCCNYQPPPSSSVQQLLSLSGVLKLACVQRQQRSLIAPQGISFMYQQYLRIQLDCKMHALGVWLNQCTCTCLCSGMVQGVV